MPPDAHQGRVLLVGAGPGPADLLTVRAARAIGEAQALLYDALVGDEVLALAQPGCTRIQTGKRAGRASMEQATINGLMVRLARQGLSVVRLKGGDPSIFGRVGEEIDHLRAHGVAFEVVPGVTAACAAAAQFALPLTHRGVARQVVFSTGRAVDGLPVRAGGRREAATLALYMARDAIAAQFEVLVADGWPARTPAAAVENAGRPDASLICGDLACLPERLRDAAPTGPVLVLVGEIAGRAGAGLREHPCPRAREISFTGAGTARA